MALPEFRAASQRMRRARGASLGLALGLASVAAGPLAAWPTPALAATVSNQVTLPVASFSDMVVDGAHSHVFVSSPGSNEVLVLDYQGNIVQTIAESGGPSAMVLQDSTLYVALNTAGAIDRIDTATLAESGLLTAAGSLTHPSQLVLAAGALWTGTQTPDYNNVCIARVDMGTGAVTSFTHVCQYGLGIRSNPTDANMLITWDLGLEPATITTYDVSSGSPATLHSQWEQRLENLQDIAGGPSGTSFVAASGWPYEFDEWSYSDLQQNGTVYPASNYPTAVATTGANGGLVAGGLNAPYGNALWVYRFDSPSHLFFSGLNGDDIAPRGVAFSPDGQLVFAVSVVWNGSTDVTTFTVVDLQLAPPPVVSASPVSDTEGQQFSGVVGSFSGGTAPYTATVNWGDGTSPTSGTMTADGNGGFTVAAQHVFAEEGSPHVSLTVVDATGATVTAGAAATVADAPISVTVNTAPQSSTATTHAVATLSDGDAGGVASDYSGSVSMFVGSVPVGPAFACPSTLCSIAANGTGGFSITISSALPPGSYRTTVTVSDAGGATSGATGTVTVS